MSDVFPRFLPERKTFPFFSPRFLSTVLNSQHSGNCGGKRVDRTRHPTSRLGFQAFRLESADVALQRRLAKVYRFILQYEPPERSVPETDFADVISEDSRLEGA